MRGTPGLRRRGGACPRPFCRTQVFVGGRFVNRPYGGLLVSAVGARPWAPRRPDSASLDPASLDPLRHPACVRRAATPPPCGARKMLRAYAIPCVFRPLRKFRAPFFRHRRREPAIPPEGRQERGRAQGSYGEITNRRTQRAAGWPPAACAYIGAGGRAMLVPTGLTSAPTHAPRCG